MRLTSMLYKAARLSNDISTWASGDPKRIARHYLNKAITKVAAKFYLRGR